MERVRVVSGVDGLGGKSALFVLVISSEILFGSFVAIDFFDELSILGDSFGLGCRLLTAF